MQTLRSLTLAAFAAGLLAPASTAQDSVSLTGCLPGDAPSPWADGSAPNGSEQTNLYAVELSKLTSSWNQTYGVAPLVKSGKTGSQFFGSLMGGNGISRDQLVNSKFTASQYATWSAPGQGVNGDPTINSTPTLVGATNLRGTQFAAVFAERATTDNGAAYQGIVTAVVNVDPSDPSRLYVNRVQTAVNSCDDFSDLAALAAGSVDANGYTAFRSDGFGMAFGGCNSTFITGNNVFIVDALARTPNALNIISDLAATQDLPGAVTHWVVKQDQTTSYNTPALMPSSVAGGLPIFLGSNFASQFARSGVAGPLVNDASHFAPGTTDHRGNVAYHSGNFAPLGSTHGVCAMIGVGAGGTDRINYWGLDGSANVTGTGACVIPAVVTDNDDGFTNGFGPNIFDHYHSQVAFQGGNGQIAIGYDPAGNLLLAGEIDHPDTGPDNQWGGNYIGVCRVDATTGVDTWTMAGWVDPTTGVGKNVLDGPNGLPVYRMKVGVPGPSMSSPMIDSYGNVYFVAFIESLDGLFTTDVALLRANLDAATFSYQLELLVKSGDVFDSAGTGLKYMVTSLRLLDADSIASDAPFSQSITEAGWLGVDTGVFAGSDPRTLGGIVLAANVVYDVDQDLVHDTDCFVNGTFDESYRVLLYIAPNGDSGQVKHGQGCPGFGGFQPTLSMSGFPAAGEPVTFRIDDGIGGQQALLFYGVGGPAQLSLGGGCFLNVNPAPALFGPIAVPLLGAGAGGGAIDLPVTLPATLPAGLGITLQAICTDPTTVLGASATQGLTITIQP